LENISKSFGKLSEIVKGFLKQLKESHPFWEWFCIIHFPLFADEVVSLFAILVQLQ
jgi:hypothetical protein